MQFIYKIPDFSLSLFCPRLCLSLCLSLCLFLCVFHYCNHPPIDGNAHNLSVIDYRLVCVYMPKIVFVFAYACTVCVCVRTQARIHTVTVLFFFHPSFNIFKSPLIVVS